MLYVAGQNRDVKRTDKKWAEVPADAKTPVARQTAPDRGGERHIKAIS